MIPFSVRNLGAFLKNSSGNILFLILIAVALFATLGYAVTQSMRSGGNNVIQETSTINAAVLSQYTASLRSAIQRMTTDNHDIRTLEFNRPEDFATLTSTSVGIFHPSGGAVIYQKAPFALLDTQSGNPTGKWIFSMNFEVKDIGTNSTSSLDGNDLIAFMVGVRKEVCEQLDKKLAIPTNPIPKITGLTYSSDMITNTNTYDMDNNYVSPTSESVIGAGADDVALAGKSEGCYYEATGNTYVYYGVISER